MRWILFYFQIGSRSSVYSSVSDVRKIGSYIYEEFMPTDGTDVKVGIGSQFLIAVISNVVRICIMQTSTRVSPTGVHCWSWLRARWSQKVSSTWWQSGTWQERKGNSISSDSVRHGKAFGQKCLSGVQGKALFWLLASVQNHNLCCFAWHLVWRPVCSKQCVDLTCWGRMADRTSVTLTDSASSRHRKSTTTTVRKSSGQQHLCFDSSGNSPHLVKIHCENSHACQLVVFGFAGTRFWDNFRRSFIFLIPSPSNRKTYRLCQQRLEPCEAFLAA